MKSEAKYILAYYDGTIVAKFIIRPIKKDTILAKISKSSNISQPTTLEPTRVNKKASTLPIYAKPQDI